MDTSVVIAASDDGDQLVPECARRSTVVVAADGGLDLAERVGLAPIAVVGDLDSVSAGALDRARDRGVDIVEWPNDKDHTDLELALTEAASRGRAGDNSASESLTLVLGGAGGRLDHLLANVGVIAANETPIEGWIGRALVVPVRGEWCRMLPAGLTVSVIPWGGDATVTTTGLRWGLNGEVLPLGTARGVSNVAEGGEVVVSVTDGCVLVVIPDAGGLA